MNTTTYLGMLIKNVGLSWYVPSPPQTMSILGWEWFETREEARAYIRKQVRG